MNTCVKQFRSFRWPECYGVATSVRARNCREFQFKRLTGPMSYGEAVYQAERIAREHTQVAEAINELTARWGYRDVTDLLRRFHYHLRDTHPDEYQATFAYLCVLQQPSGGPVYCRTARRLFKELEEARAANVQYEQGCPAPDPREHMWMIAGNFDLEDDDKEGEEAAGPAPTT